MADHPITGADLDLLAALARGADDAAEALALLAAGVVDTASWRATLGRSRRGAAGFVRWQLSRTAFDALSQPTAAATLDPEFLRELLSKAQDSRRYVRVSVEGDVVPTEAVPRLLRIDGVNSVVIPVNRPVGALKPRTWEWPLRLGFIGIDAAAVEQAIMRLPDAPPEGTVVCRDIAVEPAAVDVLFAMGPLALAAAGIVASRQVANAVVIIDDASGSWSVTTGHLSVVRAATAATITVLVQLTAQDADRRVTELAQCISTLARLMSTGAPFDVAVTVGFDAPTVVGELDALSNDTDLAQIARRVRGELRIEIGARGGLGVKNLSRLDATLGPLTAIADDPEAMIGLDDFAAPRIPEVRDEVNAALPDPPNRILQCTVRPVDRRRWPTGGNQVVAGANIVSVFIGPAERDALRGGGISDAQLGFDATDSDSARVTVVFIPLIPNEGAETRALTAELDVPRAGRSGDVSLLWKLPRSLKSGQRVSARILVMFRNRTLQTAVLTGTVDGDLQLQQRVQLHSGWSDLNDRRAFDVAIVKNRDARRAPLLVVKADEGVIATRKGTLTAITDNIGKLMVEAAAIQGNSAAAEKKRLRMLIDLAVVGFDYWMGLEPVLQGMWQKLRLAERVQILTVESPRTLPLELAYTGQPPDDNATLCPSWERRDVCGPHCFEIPEPTSIVCPAAFFGMSRVIERYYTDSTARRSTSLQAVDPRAGRRKLAVDSTLVAASRKVHQGDKTKTVASFGPGASPAGDWSDWKQQLAKQPQRNLLVLLPHNTDPPALEIANTTLARGRLIESYVVGAAAAATHPMVLLFGCDTAGLATDPSGWSTRFLQMRAAVVFSTLTMLHAKNAATLAQIMAKLLRDPSRPEQSIGTLTQQFRRTAVREGLISALGVASYGDTDWTV